MPGQADGKDLLYLLRDRGDDIPNVIVSGWVDDDATREQPDCVHAVLKKTGGRRDLAVDRASGPRAGLSI